MTPRPRHEYHELRVRSLRPTRTFGRRDERRHRKAIAVSAKANILLETLTLERPALEQFLTNRLGCSAAAEDIIQSLSERLIRGPVECELVNPRAYVFRAAANAAVDHVRASSKRLAYESEAAILEKTNPAHPEREVLGLEALREVEVALQDLPALSRRMFLLHRVEGVPQKEIAARFGVSLSTVEKRIAKAAAHCHSRLVEMGFTGSVSRNRLQDK